MKIVFEAAVFKVLAGLLCIGILIPLGLINSDKDITRKLAEKFPERTSLDFEGMIFINDEY